MNKNYIPWEFDREFTKEQKIRRLKDIKKYLLELIKKMYCGCMKYNMWEKIMVKYLYLMYEMNDLSWNLNMDENEMNDFEEEIEKVKKSFGWCITCFEEYEPECSCDLCEKCWRIPEICFCSND